jgi:hypothetical protein
MIKKGGLKAAFFDHASSLIVVTAFLIVIPAKVGI